MKEVNLETANSKSEVGIKKIASKSSHSVKCITTNREFNSISEASKFYNINRQDIYNCCKEKQKSGGKIILDHGTEYKLVWRYLEDSN
jgi:hypothetical protein